MHRLYLLRHAKSAWPDHVADRERPLALRGIQAAPIMAAYMARQDFLPNTVVVSSARRTRETFALIGPFLGEPEVNFLDAIYGASAHQLLGIIQEAPESAFGLLIVGHNPGLSDLAYLLTDPKKSNAAAMAHLSVKYPTTGLAVFHLATIWKDLRAGNGVLRHFVTPHQLGGVDED